MSLIVVTGGIGCGKSTLLKEFARLGSRVADADELSHGMYRRGCVAYHAMVGRWGESILDADGEIERSRVASIVFENGNELSWLNELIHPLVRHEIESLSVGDELFCAIPLFYESGWTLHESCVISSWCDEATQLERLRRRGWSESNVRHRLASQLSRDEKLRRADIGIITSCSWESLREQCRRVHELICR